MEFNQETSLYSYIYSACETGDHDELSVVLYGRENYREWRRAMNLKLEMTKKLCFVDGTVTVPAKDDPKYGAWKTRNELVLSWIRGSISEEIKENVEALTNAVDVWRGLRQLYSPGDPLLISDVEEEIDSLRQETRTLTEYFVKYNALWMELETLLGDQNKCSCGKEKMEQEKVKTFLKGLHERFHSTRSRIMRENRPLPSLHQVFTLIAEHEELVNVATNEVTRREKLIPNQHPHGLTLKPPTGAPFKCSGCRERGFGWSYRCENDECKDDYVLCEPCANAVMDKPLVRHPFFKESNFLFYEKPASGNRICDGCRKDVLGFVYHCTDTDLDLHPRCFNLKRSISVELEEEEEEEEESVSVSVRLELTRKIPKKCVKCKSKKVGGESKVEGWAYESSDGKFCYHVSCFKEIKLEDGYFSKEKLRKKKDYDEKVAVRSKKSTVSGGGGKKKGSGGKMKKYFKIAAVVFQLVFAAIFGDPISLSVGFIHALGLF
ncbi:uncharacterized protein LOC127746553 [Arachis duranensis]|uniref:Uncharacterized protein LOC127746553 n=1 Tax=Arachis duranensis TaxID=130453 RepID=A0A9C6WHQ9_ARADU|nr:uncharacterized protein LOC127746553 [Arachis duranensis]